MFRLISIVAHVKCYLFIALLTFNFSAIAQEDFSKSVAEAEVAKIKDIFNDDDISNAGGGKWLAASVHREKLITLGRISVSPIKKAIDTVKDINHRRFLVFCLTDIDAKEVDELLLSLYFDQKEPNKHAMHVLKRRADKGKLLQVAISEAKLESIINKMATEKVLSAGHTARVLAILKQNSIQMRIEPILQRFTAEVDNPTINYAPSNLSYISPRVGCLNLYLYAFDLLGEESWPYLRKALSECPKDNQELRKWLTIALGTASEPSVANDLKSLCLEENEDLNVRYVAIKAYGLSAKNSAIPVLESLTKDNNISDFYTNPDGSAYYPIRAAAGGALGRLEYAER